ncbi:MAG: M20/M25/M40 family metallo-hydrolase [Planctomycetes bacterium]|nr:M20/M25/M40 family metallo-hydrolase [Planctomycetota bacterium]
MLALALLAALAAALFGAAAPPKHDWPPEVQKALRSITARECLEHVTVLASDAYEGRDTGEPGGRLAAKYVQRHLEELELEPGGDAGTWFQGFPLQKQPRTGPLEEVNLLAAGKKPRDPKAKSYRFLEDFVPALESKEGEARGGCYLLAAQPWLPGVAPEIPAEAKGRIVIAPEPPGADQNERTRTFSATLAKAGATAWLVLPTEPEAEAPKKESWPVFLAEDAPLCTLPVLRLSRETAESLLKKGGMTLPRADKGKPAAKTPAGPLKDVHVELAVARKGFTYGRGRNIISIHRGSDPKLKEEAIVIGAHYDHIGFAKNPQLTRGKPGELHNGADDNASGTAGILEVAEAFASHKIATKRTVIFMSFDGEEQGLLGSRYFVAHPTFPLEKIRCMLNIDMISRNEPRAMYFGKLDRFKELNDIVEGVARRFGIFLNPEGMAQYMNRSDQEAFIARNIPACFIFGGMHSEYHTERDDVELVDPSKMEAIARLMFLFAYECANHEGRFGD